MAESAAYKVSIGGAIGDVGELQYGFYSQYDAYDNIRDALGVVKLKESDDRRGIGFGINFPRPAKVRINFLDKNADLNPVDRTSNNKSRSCMRFCDVDKLGQVLNGALNKKKVKINGVEYAIRSVSIPGA